MLTGRRKGDLYVVSNSPESYFSYHFKSGLAEVWHQHKDKRLIDITGAIKSKHACDSCQLGKLSRSPFSSSEHFSSSIFDKIHCDLWGGDLPQFYLFKSSDIMLVW